MGRGRKGRCPKSNLLRGRFTVFLFSIAYLSFSFLWPGPRTSLAGLRGPSSGSRHGRGMEEGWKGVAYPDPGRNPPGLPARSLMISIRPGSVYAQSALDQWKDVAWPWVDTPNVKCRFRSESTKSRRAPCISTRPLPSSSAGSRGPWTIQITPPWHMSLSPPCSGVIIGKVMKTNSFHRCQAGTVFLNHARAEQAGLSSRSKELLGMTTQVLRQCGTRR